MSSHKPLSHTIDQTPTQSTSAAYTAPGGPKLDSKNNQAPVGSTSAAFTAPGGPKDSKSPTSAPSTSASTAALSSTALVFSSAPDLANNTATVAVAPIDLVALRAKLTTKVNEDLAEFTRVSAQLASLTQRDQKWAMSISEISTKFDALYAQYKRTNISQTPVLDSTEHLIKMQEDDLPYYTQNLHHTSEKIRNKSKDKIMEIQAEVAPLKSEYQTTVNDFMSKQLKPLMDQLEEIKSSISNLELVIASDASHTAATISMKIGQKS